MLIQVKLFLLSTFIGVTLGLPHINPDWIKHKIKFGLNFASAVQEKFRQVVYTLNIKAINEHNQKAAKDKSIAYTQSPNQFTHLTHEEFIEQHTGYKKESDNDKQTTTHKRETTITTTATTNTSVDWRNTTLVGPIKNQGRCVVIKFRKRKRKRDMRRWGYFFILASWSVMPIF